MNSILMSILSCINPHFLQATIQHTTLHFVLSLGKDEFNQILIYYSSPFFFLSELLGQENRKAFFKLLNHSHS